MRIDGYVRRYCLAGRANTLEAALASSLAETVLLVSPGQPAKTIGLPPANITHDLCALAVSCLRLNLLTGVMHNELYIAVHMQHSMAQGMPHGTYLPQQSAQHPCLWQGDFCAPVQSAVAVKLCDVQDQPNVAVPLQHF